MNQSRSPDLNERLEQLGCDLGSRPSRVPNIMTQIEDLPAGPNIIGPDESVVGEESAALVTSAQQQPYRKSLVRWASLVAAASLILAIAFFALQPRTLYARAMSALLKVQTIHVTGWSQEVPRTWPLEKAPEAKAAADAKHPVDMWFWRSVDGTPHTFQKCGPVTKIMIGDNEREYQQDVDLLYLAEGRANDEAEEIAALAKLLAELKFGEKESLGTKSIDDVQAVGFRVSRHGHSEEYWLDQATNLPVSYARVGNDGQKQVEFQFHYDETVPEDIVAYEPPKAKALRYGGSHPDVNVAWKQHVQELWLTQDLPETGSVIVPRETKFGNEWVLPTPDGKYKVFPIDSEHSPGMDLNHFVRNRVVYHTNECVCGECDGPSICNTATWRIDSDLSEFMFPRCDLIVAKDTPWQEWVQFFLNQNGLKYTDVQEERTFWTAEHDGQKQKSWQRIKPPVPYLIRNGKPLYGVVVTGRGAGIHYGGGGGNGVTLVDLLNGLNRNQAASLQADGIIVKNNTQLPMPPKRDLEAYPNWQEWEKVVSKYYVATDVPYFNGEAGRKMAREWYEKELGITFVENTQTLTTHVITRK